MLLNNWIKSYINPVTYPNNIWFRHHFERNFDAIFLGNGIDAHNYPQTSVEGPKVFNLALRNQTLLRDFKVLKQNFSILKPGGKAYFPIDAVSIMVDSDVQDKRPYVYTDYGHTLSLSKTIQVYKKLCKYYPVLMLRFADYRYLVRHKLHGDEQYHDDVVRFIRCSHTIKGRSLEGIESRITDIMDFCKERNIVPVFILKPVSSVLKNEDLDMSMQALTAILKHNGSEYIDLYSKEECCCPDLYAADGMLMNEKGRDISKSCIDEN